MSDELICPDCGGIVGATEITDEGKPCTCFAAVQKKNAAVPAPSLSVHTADASRSAELLRDMGLKPVELESDSHGSNPGNGGSSLGPESTDVSMVLDPSTSAHGSMAAHSHDDAQAATAGQSAEKVCFKCGVSVAGRSRFKDSRGYLCRECHKAEIAEEKTNPKCADCGRRVKAAALSEHRGRMICGLCRADLVAGEKHDAKFSPIKAGTYKEAEKKQIKWMVGIVAFLLIVIILHKLRILGGFF